MNRDRRRLSLIFALLSSINSSFCWFHKINQEGRQQRSLCGLRWLSLTFRYQKFQADFRTVCSFAAFGIWILLECDPFCDDSRNTVNGSASSSRWNISGIPYTNDSVRNILHNDNAYSNDTCTIGHANWVHIYNMPQSPFEIRFENSFSFPSEVLLVVLVFWSNLIIFIRYFFIIFLAYYQFCAT